MSLSDPLASAERWLHAFRAAAEEAHGALAARTDAASREREVGTIGAGGDATLEIDAIAEDSVFAQLDRLSGEGASFIAVSEERGEVDYGGQLTRVVIDPIDGSLNAKRGVLHSAMSIAVSDGPSAADLALGFVYDFATGETFHAVRGRGAFLNGERLPALAERRTSDGRLEMLCVETSDARAIAEVAEQLSLHAYRWRVIGSIAVALCQLAASRVDAMVNVTRCRVLDAAAGALIVSESGGTMCLQEGETIGLTLQERTMLSAARSPSTARELLASIAGGASVGL